jgi:hypothetical protein
MKRRPSIGWILGLFYLVALLCFGVAPHHHADPGDTHADCPTCVWQTTTATDAPAPPFIVTRNDIPVEWDVVVAICLPATFAPATASRAPPETLV